jgi:hypothetical protein
MKTPTLKTPTLAVDKKNSARINAIRQANGGSTSECPTCCRPVNSPFRVFDEAGKVVMGCVDAAHEGHFPRPSESAVWHYRHEARDMRRQDLARLK